MEAWQGGQWGKVADKAGGGMVRLRVWVWVTEEENEWHETKRDENVGEERENKKLIFLAFVSVPFQIWNNIIHQYQIF